MAERLALTGSLGTGSGEAFQKPTITPHGPNQTVSFPTVATAVQYVVGIEVCRYVLEYGMVAMRYMLQGGCTSGRPLERHEMRPPFGNLAGSTSELKGS